MNKYLFFVLMWALNCNAIASNSFSCPIKEISTSPSAQNLLIVHMSCSSNSPIESNTNGCTATSVSNNSFLLDTSNEHGKMNFSTILMAFASGKKIYASTYANCPASVPNTPILYSLKVYND